MTMIMSELFEPLFSDAFVREFGVGDALFRVGDKVVSMILILDGQADLVRHSNHGLRMILHRTDKGQILAEASAWSEVYHCDAIASLPSTTAFLPRKVFWARLQAEPLLMDCWAQNLAQAVQAARVRAEIRSLPKVTDRLNAWLSEGHPLPDKGHWQDVAAELGITRESLYRELARRRNDGCK